MIQSRAMKFFRRVTRRAALAVIVTTLLSACSSLPQVNVGDIARIAATPMALVPDATVTPAPPEVSTAALVKQRSRIRVGIRYDAPPLARVNADGKLEGMDVDLAREFARRWLGGERNVEFVQVTSISAPQKIRSREIDLAMGGLVHARAAEADADFSLTYLNDGEAMLVRTGTFSDFVSMAQRTVTYIDLPSTNALSAAQIENNVTVTLQGQNSYRAAVNDLLAGSTDGVVGRWRRLRATAMGDPALAIASVFTVEPVAIMLPQNDSDWADLVNLTLSSIILDGTFNQMYEKWFGAAPDAAQTIAQLTPLQLVDLPDALSRRDGLSAMRAANVVRVGFDPQATPFAFVNGEGQPEGYEVDLVREMARRWFGDPSIAQFTPTGMDQLANALNGSALDLGIGGVQRTAANERSMDFSSATFVSSGVPLGIALPTNDSALRDLVNLTLQDMLADGAYARIFGKWFPDQAINEIERWPGNNPTIEMLLAPPTPALMPTP